MKPFIAVSKHGIEATEPSRISGYHEQHKILKGSL